MGKFLRLVILAAALAVFARYAGRILVVEHLQKADAMVVLEGETDRRPALALQLLKEGYAPRVLIDVPRDARVYQRTYTQLAEDYVHNLPPETAAAVSVCQVNAFSTMGEADQVGRCLEASSARSMLLVTSQYHTRRALSIFRHRFPDRQIGIAGAVEPAEFGAEWWRHRQWAKVTLAEWTRLVWWECVDRWRS
jgi:uncharacterized SAM-binding protein YcdF (DUF218 family)